MRSPLDALRPDLRPEAFDIPAKLVVFCTLCPPRRKPLQRFEAVIVAPISLKPEHAKLSDGRPMHMCMDHLRGQYPDAVIVDPGRDYLCRDLNGKEWRETEPKANELMPRLKDAL